MQLPAEAKLGQAGPGIHIAQRDADAGRVYWKSGVERGHRFKFPSIVGAKMMRSPHLVLIDQHDMRQCRDSLVKPETLASVNVGRRR